MADAIDKLLREANREMRELKRLKAKQRADGSLPPPAEATDDAYDAGRRSHAVAELEQPALTDLDEGVQMLQALPAAPYLNRGPDLVAPNRKIVQYLEWLKRQTRTALMSHWYDAFKQPPPREDVSRDWLVTGLATAFRMNLYDKLGVETYPPASMQRFDFNAVRELLVVGDGVHVEGGAQVYPEPTGREEFHAPKYLRLVAIETEETRDFIGKRLKKHHVVNSFGARGLAFTELILCLERLGLGGKSGPEVEAKRMFTKWVKAGWCKTTLPEGAPAERVVDDETEEEDDDDNA